VELVVVVEFAQLALVVVDHVFVQDVFELVRPELAFAQVVLLGHLHRAVVQQQLQLRVVQVQRLLQDHRVFRVVVQALVARYQLLVQLVDLVTSAYIHQAIFRRQMEWLLHWNAVQRWLSRRNRQAWQLACQKRWHCIRTGYLSASAAFGPAARSWGRLFVWVGGLARFRFWSCQSPVGTAGSSSCLVAPAAERRQAEAVSRRRQVGPGVVFLARVFRSRSHR
jgi:hypothetical protein